MPTTQQSFAAGSIVGQFELVRELANDGNMSWMYEARVQGNPHRRVALKLARVDEPEYGDLFAKLLQGESRLLVSLLHPGVVRVYPIVDYGDVYYVGRASQLDKKPWYFAMEFLPGDSMNRHHAALIKLPVDWKLELIYQIASIVAYLHTVRVAHRDLKPSNIVFRYTPHPNHMPHPVLIDFGIAEKRAIAEKRRAAQLSSGGTLAYTPPERVDGLVSDGPDDAYTPTEHFPTDVWALGVMAYELISGQYPFGATNVRPSVLAGHIKNDSAPTLRRLIPPGADQVIRGMLEKSPRSRPTIFQVCEALDTRVELFPPRIDIR